VDDLRHRDRQARLADEAQEETFEGGVPARVEEHQVSSAFRNAGDKVR